MKKLIYTESFWQIFPEALCGVVVIDQIPDYEHDTNHDEACAQLLNNSFRDAEKYFVSEVISECPVASIWREAYRKFPTKGGARCTIENLLKRVLKGNPPSSISPVIDVTNAVSLRWALPIGAEDLGAIEGNLRVDVCKGDESFIPIGGKGTEEPPVPGELAYLDDAGVVCRCWNWRDGIRTAINDSTTTAIFAMECVDPERKADLEQAVAELADHAEKLLGAKVITSGVISRDQPELKLI